MSPPAGGPVLRLASQAPGVTTEAAKEIRELKRKVSELERTVVL